MLLLCTPGGTIQPLRATLRLTIRPRWRRLSLPSPASMSSRSASPYRNPRAELALPGNRLAHIPYIRHTLTTASEPTWRRRRCIHVLYNRCALHRRMSGERIHYFSILRLPTPHRSHGFRPSPLIPRCSVSHIPARPTNRKTGVSAPAAPVACCARGLLRPWPTAPACPAFDLRRGKMGKKKGRAGCQHALPLPRGNPTAQKTFRELRTAMGTTVRSWDRRECILSLGGGVHYSKRLQMTTRRSLFRYGYVNTPANITSPCDSPDNRARVWSQRVGAVDSPVSSDKHA